MFVIGALGFVMTDRALYIRVMVHNSRSDQADFKARPSKPWAAELARKRKHVGEWRTRQLEGGKT